MTKETQYADKINEIKEFLPLILADVKKELKKEHLPNDRAFAKRFFSGKVVDKLPIQELVTGYIKALEEESFPELREFIATRWLLKNTEVYQFFEAALSAIQTNFEELKELPADREKTIHSDAVTQFGPLKTFLFSHINSVAFSPATFSDLRADAKKEAAEIERASCSTREANPRLEAELQKLESKYEKKLAGLQKKYLHDVEALKKQIRTLHQKLHEAKR